MNFYADDQHLVNSQASADFATKIVEISEDGFRKVRKKKDMKKLQKLEKIEIILSRWN